MRHDARRGAERYDNRGCRVEVSRSRRSSMGLGWGCMHTYDDDDDDSEYI